MRTTLIDTGVAGEIAIVRNLVTAMLPTIFWYATALPPIRQDLWNLRQGNILANGLEPNP